MDDVHALDAVLAWLDAESLLRAAMVCRRWAGRATRDGAWRGRVAEVAWTRGVRAHDAYRRSLNVRARWRRGRVTATALMLGRGRLLCADGDWLAVAVRGRGLCWTGGAAELEETRTVYLYDAAVSRTVGTLPVRATAAALSRDAARCVTIAHPAARRDRPVCAVWTPPPDADGGAWRSACEVPLGCRVSDSHRMHLCWHGDALAVLRDGPQGGDARVLAEWFDVGAGQARCVARHAFSVPAGCDVPWDHEGALLMVGNAVYALDPRAPPEPPPLARLPRMETPLERSRVLSLDGGRRFVTCATRACRYGKRLELWDARAGTAPVAALHDERWYDVPRGIALRGERWDDVLCGTARGTVLGSATVPCAAHRWCAVSLSECAWCRLSVREWDPARGAADEVAAVGNSGTLYVSCPWADERRVLLDYGKEGLHLLDADRCPQRGNDACIAPRS